MTKTITVRQLMDLLEKEDPKARVGITMSSLNGWVAGVEKLQHDEHGVVCLNQTEETLYEEEVTVR